MGQSGNLFLRSFSKSPRRRTAKPACVEKRPTWESGEKAKGAYLGGRIAFNNRFQRARLMARWIAAFIVNQLLCLAPVMRIVQAYARNACCQAEGLALQLKRPSSACNAILKALKE
jgi:hypothetical protein